MPEPSKSAATSWSRPRKGGFHPPLFKPQLSQSCEPFG
jgi:hypothetical protein